MAISSRAGVSDGYPTVQEEVARLSASPEIRSAFNWFRTQEPQLAHWQLEMARIAAPPFGEGPRAAWLAERFRELGLDDVRVVAGVSGLQRPELLLQVRKLLFKCLRTVTCLGILPCRHFLGQERLAIGFVLLCPAQSLGICLKLCVQPHQ